MPSTAVYFDALPPLIAVDRRLLDVVRRVEVGLADPEPDDVAASRFERARHVRHRDGGGRLDALQRVREKGHGNLLLPSGTRVAPMS